MARPISAPVARARGRVAALSRSRLATDPELTAAKRDLTALTLDQHVSRVVADAPPLTDEQVERIAARLRGAIR